MAALEFQNLNSDFVVELMKCCLYNQTTMDIVKEHLAFPYLQTDIQKKLWKGIIDNYEVSGKLPSIGVLGQQFNKDKDVITLLAKIKGTDISDKRDTILDNFEDFIRYSKFVNLYDEVGNLYNDGKATQAIKMLAEKSEQINTFSIKDNAYTTVFKDFEVRNAKRKQKSDLDILNEKIPFGIRELDNDLQGGGRKGTSGLVMARSGGGKSTMLKWVGANAARLGKIVIHFQAEGTEEENLDMYDANWTSVNLELMEFGNIPDNLVAEIKRARTNIMQKGGEIYVKSSETFDSMSINSCREFIKEIVRKHGHVDLILFDYLEIFTVKGQYGNGDASERKRREDIANKITNIATEFKCFCLAATQANDIKPEQYNDDEFKLTRSHISEYKGCLKPFSYFITINQTDDEATEGRYRLFTDKLRRHRARKIYKIWSSLSNNRFCDNMETQRQLAKGGGEMRVA